MQDFSHSLPMMLYRALDAVMPPFRKLFNEFGLTETQWRVLRVLWEKDGVGLSELSEITLIPAPSLVGVIDRLSANGLVERRRPDGDRRTVRVVATPAGRAIEAEVMPRVEQTYSALRGSVDEQVWKNLLKGLAEIASADPDPAAHDARAATSRS